MEHKIRLYDDKDLVEFKSVEGWVTYDGYFYGKDEHLARYAAMTHKKCDKCENLIEKNSYCNFCREKWLSEGYKNMEFKEWDGLTPLVIYDSDTYFFNEGQVNDYFYEYYGEYGETESIRLVICEPNYLREVEEDYWEEVIPQDWDLKDCDVEIAEKLKELNKIIRESRPCSWREGKYKTKFHFKI